MTQATPREVFSDAIDALPQTVMVWLDGDEMVLDGRYTFAELTIIYEAWKRYREQIAPGKE